LVSLRKKLIEVWDINSKQVISKQNLESQSIKCACLSAEGKLLFIGTDRSIIRVYNVEKGMCFCLFLTKE